LTSKQPTYRHVEFELFRLRRKAVDKCAASSTEPFDGSGVPQCTPRVVNALWSFLQEVKKLQQSMIDEDREMLHEQECDRRKNRIE